MNEAVVDLIGELKFAIDPFVERRLFVLRSNIEMPPIIKGFNGMHRKDYLRKKFNNDCDRI